MKKGIIVLLIAVLVAGFAFADGVLTAGTLTGDATITFGVDFDDKTFGFDNATSWKYNFKFEFDSTKVAVGEDHQTELWAELAAEATAYIQVKDGKTDAPAAPITTSVKITKANIHVGEWTFGILNMGTGPNYAASYYKTDGKSDLDVLAGPDKLEPGFTVSYKDYNAGFGLKGHWTDEEVHFSTAGWLETKAFKFGENEEFSAQAGAYARYFNEPLMGGFKYAGVALKGGYDAEKLDANVAADMQIIRLGGENTFAYEAAADATYTINDNGKAGVNVYSVYDKAVDEPEVYSKGVKLDAKAWANYNFDFDGTKLETTAYVDVRDILTDERTFEVKATEKLTLDKVVLEFSEKYGYMKVTVFDDFKIEAYAFQFTAKATYTAEKFTATAGIDDLTFGKLTIGSDSVTAMILKASCGISSKAIIENAEIGATYKNFGVYKIFASGLDDSTEITKGAIEVYAKIAF